MTIAIIQYGAGNTTSVMHALQRLGQKVVLTDDPQQIASADKVIFPGVGAAGYAMQQLKLLGLDTLIPRLQQPVLGICLGQQLMCNHSEEQDTTCLGIFDSEVRLFPPVEKVPHMGWNHFTKVEHPLWQGLRASDDVYFVHSYYCTLSHETIGTCDYILPFAAAMQKDNFFATQFHPEKSGAVGQQILKNFCAYSG